MRRDWIEEEVVVRPVNGMQLSEGYIRMQGSMQFIGSLPGIAPSIGDTVEDVLIRLEQKAKAYYGDDVIVEIVSHVVGF